MQSFHYAEFTAISQKRQVRHLVTSLQPWRQRMAMILRWRDDPFDCAFRDAQSGGTLTILVEGEVVWDEPCSSAAAAYDRLQQLRAVLLARRAKRA